MKKYNKTRRNYKKKTTQNKKIYLKTKQLKRKNIKVSKKKNIRVKKLQNKTRKYLGGGENEFKYIDLLDWIADNIPTSESTPATKMFSQYFKKHNEKDKTPKQFPKPPKPFRGALFKKSMKDEKNYLSLSKSYRKINNPSIVFYPRYYVAIPFDNEQVLVVTFRDKSFDKMTKLFTSGFQIPKKLPGSDENKMSNAEKESLQFEKFWNGNMYKTERLRGNRNLEKEWDFKYGNKSTKQAFVFDLKNVKRSEENDNDFEIEVHKLISKDAYNKDKNTKLQMSEQTNDDEYKILKYNDMPIIEFNDEPKSNLYIRDSTSTLNIRLNYDDLYFMIKQFPDLKLFYSFLNRNKCTNDFNEKNFNEIYLFQLKKDIDKKEVVEEEINPNYGYIKTLLIGNKNYKTYKDNYIEKEKEIIEKLKLSDNHDAIIQYFENGIDNYFKNPKSNDDKLEKNKKKFVHDFLNHFCHAYYGDGKENELQEKIYTFNIMIKDIQRVKYCITQDIPLYIIIKVLIIAFDYFLVEKLDSVKNIYSQTYSHLIDALIKMWFLPIQDRILDIKEKEIKEKEIKELEKSIFASFIIFLDIYKNKIVLLYSGMDLFNNILFDENGSTDTKLENLYKEAENNEGISLYLTYVEKLYNNKISCQYHTRIKYFIRFFFEKGDTMTIDSYLIRYLEQFTSKDYYFKIILEDQFDGLLKLMYCFFLLIFTIYNERNNEQNITDILFNESVYNINNKEILFLLKVYEKMNKKTNS